MSEYAEGYYHLKRQSGPEPVLAHGYKCADMHGDFVFGFNTHDGGGLLPLSDLTDDTVVTPVTIVLNEKKGIKNA